MPQIISPSQVIKCEDIVSCFQSLYNFFFMILLALAFLWFVYGAFQYLLSGATIFSKEEGKKKMVNSVIAVIVVLIIPPVLQLINPEIFTGITLKIPINLTVRSPELYNPNIPGTFPGGGTSYGAEVPSFNPYKAKQGCNIPEDHPFCSPNKIKEVANMQISDDLANKLALICIYESGGNPDLESSIDRCQCTKGQAFSIGLFQINMAVRNFTTPDGVQCNYQDIFNFTGVCSNLHNVYSCYIKNQDLYNKCVEALKDPKFNIQKALELAAGGSGLNHWSVWTAGVKNCFY